MKTAVLLLALLTGCAGDLRDMNKTVNAHKYIPDNGVLHLKTPEEFYKDGGGVCHDFVNAKIKAAQELGYKPENMRLILQASPDFGKVPHARGHMILQIGKYALDSQHDDIDLAALVPGNRVKVEYIKTVVEGWQ